MHAEQTELLSKVSRLILPVRVCTTLGLSLDGWPKFSGWDGTKQFETLKGPHRSLIQLDGHHFGK
jgi:hypothetical protein